MEGRLRHLLFALATLSPAGVIAQTTTGTGTGTSTSAATTTSTLTPETFEVDVIFPLQNVTYNLTEALPIVFAVQNMPAAGLIGDYTFGWDIMPWGDVGGPVSPGGVLEDSWQIQFASIFSPANPHIIVNTTNAKKWTHGPRYPYGSVYALQWYVQWGKRSAQCDLGVYGQILFNIDTGAPEPDLLDLPQCPQLAAQVEVTITNIPPGQSSSSCATAAVASNTGSGNPCAVAVDKAMASSISSVAYSLASAATITSTQTPTPTSMTTKNAATAYGAPSRPLLAAALLVGSLELVPLY